MTEFVFTLAGLSVGFMLSDFFGRKRYQRLLALCARLETPERFPDGCFYYIVPETRYVELTIEAAKQGGTS